MTTAKGDLFRRKVSCPDAEVDLLEAALLIAAEEYPTLSIMEYRTRVDQWANSLDQQIPPDGSLSQRINSLNSYFFGELGFSGNLEDYYDPRNSYLNEVIDRRLGIPISLSVLYMTLGHRIGLPLQGISFPGHFLVKIPIGDAVIVLDPFNGGISLDERDLMDLLKQIFHTEMESVDSLRPLLTQASNKDILIRMLRNLKSIHQQNHSPEKALSAVNLILTINPTLDEEYRDRGLLLQGLDCPHTALHDLRRYLRQRPDATDAEEIRRTVLSLQEKNPQLH